ncbi:hypothetical protein [Paenibacillus plantiphilus]|uniref:hypothetical protein n=1 Tax=Paenibacillus plantiphilus TaxID=2905650 RepID=UPI001F34D874|nr:hypothetical protein [Paenibacillus plantiphilus]
MIISFEAEDSNDFHLDGCGYIVVLEVGDNVRDLGNVGLNRENSGMLGSCPEYVELLNVDGGLQVYKMAVLYDNDYLMTFFTQAGAHDEKVEQWLNDQAESMPRKELRKKTCPYLWYGSPYHCNGEI